MNDIIVIVTSVFEIVVFNVIELKLTNMSALCRCWCYGAGAWLQFVVSVFSMVSMAVLMATSISLIQCEVSMPRYIAQSGQSVWLGSFLLVSPAMEVRLFLLLLLALTLFIE